MRKFWGNDTFAKEADVKLSTIFHRSGECGHTDYGCDMAEYAKFYRLLGLVLVEIRASTDLRLAQCLADIVHNLPAKIRTGRPVEEIETEIRASRLGMATYFEKAFTASEDS